MLTEQEAAERAEAYCRRYKVIGRQSWRGERIPGGWFMHPTGEEAERWPGASCLVVLDDDRIFMESMATPVAEVAARYEALPSPATVLAPMDETTAEALAADFAGRTMSELGLRRWRGERFDGGWLLKPRGDDLKWNLSGSAVVVFDDGRTLRASASAPAMFVIERFEAQLAREAAQRPFDASAPDPEGTTGRR